MTSPDREDPSGRPPRHSRAEPLKGWLADLVVGIIAGSLIVGGVGESILVTARVSGSALVTVILVACGSILGVAYMRLVRARQTADDAGRPRSGLL
jgi:hypothetical protein